MDQFPVILDTRGRHGFGEDGGATGDCQVRRSALPILETKKHTMPAQENSRRSNTPLIRNLDNRRRRKQRTPRAPQRAVRGDMDALLFAEVDNLLLRERRVVLDLVDGRHDGRLRQEFLEVLLAVVGDTDGPDLWRARELLHVLPGGDVRVRVVNVAGDAVGEFGEHGVVSFTTSF